MVEWWDLGVFTSPFIHRHTRTPCITTHSVRPSDIWETRLQLEWGFSHCVFDGRRLL